MSGARTPTPWIADNVNAPDDAPTAIWMDDGTETYYHRTSQVAECFFDVSEDVMDVSQGRRVEKAEAVANAAFIVRACNSHDALVAMLKDAREELLCHTRNDAGNRNPEVISLIKDIDAALSSTAP